MKRFRILSALLIGLLLTAGQAFAQTSLTTTSLSAAVSDTNGPQTFVQVASATGIAAPGTGANLTYLFIDSELMQVRSVNSTTIGVLRGANGTRVSPHAVNSFVYVVPPQAATTVDYGGACVSANQLYLPIINVRNGNVWNCAPSTSGNQWQATNLAPVQEVKPRTVIGGVQTAAGLVSPNTAIGLNYTILPTDYTVVLATSGTTPGSVVTAIKSFTLPSHVGLAGKLLIIKDESGAISATTKIILIGTIDGTNSATATVVQLTTPWGAVGLEAGSGGWFTVWCHGGNGSTTCR